MKKSFNFLLAALTVLCISFSSCSKEPGGGKWGENVITLNADNQSGVIAQLKEALRIAKEPGFNKFIIVDASRMAQMVEATPGEFANVMNQVVAHNKSKKGGIISLATKGQKIRVKGKPSIAAGFLNPDYGPLINAGSTRAGGGCNCMHVGAGDTLKLEGMVDVRSLIQIVEEMEGRGPTRASGEYLSQIIVDTIGVNVPTQTVGVEVVNGIPVDAGIVAKVATPTILVMDNFFNPGQALYMTGRIFDKAEMPKNFPIVKLDLKNSAVFRYMGDQELGNIATVDFPNPGAQVLASTIPDPSTEIWTDEVYMECEYGADGKAKPAPIKMWQRMFEGSKGTRTKYAGNPKAAARRNGSATSGNIIIKTPVYQPGVNDAKFYNDGGLRRAYIDLGRDGLGYFALTLAASSCQYMFENDIAIRVPGNSPYEVGINVDPGLGWAGYFSIYWRVTMAPGKTLKIIIDPTYSLSSAVVQTANKAFFEHVEQGRITDKRAVEHVKKQKAMQIR